MKKLRHARSSNRVADYVIYDLNNDEALARVLEVLADTELSQTVLPLNND